MRLPHGFLFGLLAMASVLAFPSLQAGGSDKPKSDLFQNFKNPPAGYGEVAFYWWLGDTLTPERILWQLDELAGKGVTGLQVNYAHSDSGGMSWGLSFPSRPKLFSEQWWNLFGWFMREAKKRGMAVSLSDYTLGIGQGWCVDEALAEHPDLAGSELRHAQRYALGSHPVAWQLPGEPLSVTAFRIGNDSLPLPGSAVDLAPYAKGRELAWTPAEGAWIIASVWAERILLSYDPMHPLSGKAYIDKFFGRFAERFPGEAGKGINYLLLR